MDGPRRFKIIPPKIQSNRVEELKAKIEDLNERSDSDDSKRHHAVFLDQVRTNCLMCYSLNSSIYVSGLCDQCTKIRQKHETEIIKWIGNYGP